LDYTFVTGLTGSFNNNQQYQVTQASIIQAQTQQPVYRQQTQRTFQQPSPSRSSFNNANSCGIAASSPVVASFVYGGNKAYKGQFPWLVSRVLSFDATTN